MVAELNENTKIVKEMSEASDSDDREDVLNSQTTVQDIGKNA